MLDEYKKKLRECGILINEPDWPERYAKCCREMDAIWPKLSVPERQAAIDYSVFLYEQRIR